MTEPGDWGELAQGYALLYAKYRELLARHNANMRRQIIIELRIARLEKIAAQTEMVRWPLRDAVN